MSEKRFKVTDNTKNPFLCDWSVTDYADGGIVDHPMTSENMANVMCDLLNEINNENEQLKKENKELKAFLTKLADSQGNIYHMNGRVYNIQEVI